MTDQPLESRSRIARSLTAALLGGILAATLLVFVPFTLYVGNLDEFTAPFLSITLIFLPLAILFLGLPALISTRLPPQDSIRFNALLAALCIMIWLQGNILVWDYGVLDGRSIDWEADSWRGWLDLGLWLTIIATALRTGQGLARRIIYCAIAIFVMQFTLFGNAWFNGQAQLAAKTRNAPANADPNPIFQFSASKNIVQIIADGFQSDIFEEIITQGPDASRYASALDGFVFFPEHLGAFQYTHMSVPAILGGHLYRNHVPISEHMDTAVGEDSILRLAHDTGYEVDMAVPRGLASIYGRAANAHLYPIPLNYHIGVREYETQDAARLLDLALFRVVPHFFKHYIYNDQAWLVQPLMFDSNYQHLSFFSDMAFLRDLHENLSAEQERPSYTLLHLMLSHTPIVANEKCDYAGQVQPMLRSFIKTQAACGLAEVIKLLEKMKELGIYDDAIIILMADHGVWTPSARLSGTPHPIDVQAEYIGSAMVGHANPLLAIKRAGAKGPLRTSAVKSWIPDIAPTIAAIAGFPSRHPGISVMDIDADIPRQRRFYSYAYSRDDWTANYLGTINEYTVDGSIFDYRAWRRGKTYHPPGETAGGLKHSFGSPG